VIKALDREETKDSEREEEIGDAGEKRLCNRKEVNDMSREDGTGPPSGRGQGVGRGRGRGRVAGPGGKCVCPSCGTTAAHPVGVPCAQTKCPVCGAIMIRK
jgi:hypothetical protein